MVASFSIFKDYKTYFSAAKILLDRGYDVTFLAIGHNTESIQLGKFINSKYFPFIKLLGKQSGIESYVNAMDVCVLSTFTEGISNSILEYMALGKPVVATDGGGTKEIIEDKITGFLVKPSDPVELADKVEILLKDPGLINRMGQSGTARVKNFFSIHLMASKYIELYYNIK
jgi:glycosyltransferase involved in cell wall biosynthesis